jgi:solute carrier family 35 protein
VCLNFLSVLLVSESVENPTKRDEVTKTQQIGSALFYAISSIVIVFVNKSVLTVYEFPSAQMLGVGQMCAAISVLGFLKLIGKIEFPDFSMDVPRKIFPLPILYLCNMIFGLKSTQVTIIWRLRTK